MGRSDADWKHQGRHVLDWAAIVVGVAVILVYLALSWIDGQGGYVGLALFFVAWVLLFFTDYWQPVLYLLMAVLVGASLIFSLLGSGWEQPLGLTSILLRGVFLLLVVPLFFIEEQGR